MVCAFKKKSHLCCKMHFAFCHSTKLKKINAREEKGLSLVINKNGVYMDERV